MKIGTPIFIAPPVLQYGKIAYIINCISIGN